MVVTEKLATLLMRLRSIVLSVVFLALIAWNFGAINTSAKEVLGMVSHVQQFEANGIKVILRDDASLKANLTSVAAHLSDADKRVIVDTVQKLTGDQAERLFTIERGQVSCEYSSPTPKMRMFVYTDAVLADLGLLEMNEDVAAFEREVVRIAHQGSSIGKPKSCYSLQLTPRGYDAKSALVGVIRQQLG
jgi:hypothetical protein